MPPLLPILKTGECFFLDTYGNLWIAESFVDAGGVVITRHSAAETAEEVVWFQPQDSPRILDQDFAQVNIWEG